MPLVSFEYRFLVNLPASADDAYGWATDYRPDDLARMGQKGRRRIQRLADGAILLTDAVRHGGRTVTKRRLVRLRPRLRSWTNTHLAGPTRYSQFLYRIIPKGPRASMLEFIGLQIERSPRPLAAAELARRARTVAREDAAVWHHLVRAMADDLGPARRRGGARGPAWPIPQRRARAPARG